MPELENQYDWVPFYKELARKLLEYKDNRAELVEKVKQIFQNTNIKMPTLEADNQLIDIDPFTFFGLFNKGITNENRSKLVAEIANTFKIMAKIPSSFEGIPVLNNQNATFYYFIKGKYTRNDNDIDDLWKLFDSALSYISNQSEKNRDDLYKYFDLVINKGGIGTSKLTMALYWIAPDSFLNLDKNTERYIYESSKLGTLIRTLPKCDKKISATNYFDIVSKIRNYLQNDTEDTKYIFVKLSSEAYQYSEEINLKNKEIIKNKHESERTAMPDNDVRETHYWIYSPGKNAEIWNDCKDNCIMAIGWDEIGDLKKYNTKEEMILAMKEKIDPNLAHTNNGRATWEFANEMSVGDIVFAKKGRNIILGKGIVESDYFYDDTRDHYVNMRKVKWIKTDEHENPNEKAAPLKTLTDITSLTDYCEKLKALFECDDEDCDTDVAVQNSTLKYDKNKFLEEVYIDETSYETLVSLVKRKKNLILQGAPGVGKTFIAKRLAYSLMGEIDRDRVMMIQFHQSYTYEDFIMGYRPNVNGSFELQEGVFYKFCKKAKDDAARDYYFIIDEINRGNLSKIFGELFMLIESDKRGVELQLLYNHEKFKIPSNLYIIGLMNTADRSLAMLDYALRRRFAFFEMKPGFDTDGFREYLTSLGSKKFETLIDCIKELNRKIAEDESLGDGFCIGHSFFCKLEKGDNLDKDLSDIVEFEIIPLIREYWFDDREKVKDWSNKLRGAINESHT